MTGTTSIIIQTGSDQRFIDPKVTFDYLVKALNGRSLSGRTSIVINPDGKVDIGIDTIYTPKQPTLIEPSRKKRLRIR